MTGSRRPRFDVEGMAFFRRENEGYASFISGASPEGGLQLLNPGILEVAEMCTGEATVDEIQAAYAARHPSLAAEAARLNVERSLVMLGQYSLLRPEPVDVSATVPGALADGTRRLGTDDLRDVRRLLVGSDLPGFPRVPKTFFLNPYLPELLYEEMFLRLRLFNGKESFFGTFAGGELVFAVGLMDNRPVKPTAALSLIAGLEGQDLAEELGRVLPDALVSLAGEYSKLTWNFLVDPTTRERFPEIAETLGAAHAATLKDEFGPKIDEIQYEWRLGADHGRRIPSTEA